MNSIKNNKKYPLVKVVFFLDDDWHGHETESVWAEDISDNRCRIRNVPFYAKGVSLEDIVFVKREGGEVLFDAISMTAGHSTYRILISKLNYERNFERFWHHLANIGCSYESTDSERMVLLAVDVPPSTDIHKAYELLNQGEEAGIWDFEEGHCGHQI